MALTDVALRKLKTEETARSISDGGGLYIESLPSGKKRWGMKYRFNGKQETARLGDYPAFSLADARRWRDACKALVSRGLSPSALKRGDELPEDTTPAIKEMAEAFVRDWCGKTTAKAAAAKAADTVEAFGRAWYRDIAEPANKNPRNILRALEKDIFPTIGKKAVEEVTPTDVLKITDRIKKRGADQMALQTRNILKRLFAYAVARQKTTFNPAAAIDAKYIATPRSRDVALTPEEIGKLLRAIYSGSIKRQYKLALHLLIICMVRKGELVKARWDEIDFEQALWAIPAERMKQDKPHLVPLCPSALAMFEELKTLAGDSEWVLPSRGDLNQPIAHSTLNQAVRSMEIEVRDFVIHDFRRTASTHLHEAGFSSDVVEKALAHEQGGVRGIYNRAEYLPQRREMLEWWADFVDSQIEEGRKVVIGRFGKAMRAA